MVWTYLNQNVVPVEFQINDSEIIFINSSVWGGFNKFTTFYKVDLDREGLSIAEGVTTLENGNQRLALLELKLNYRSKEGSLEVGDRIDISSTAIRMGKYKSYDVKCW